MRGHFTRGTAGLALSIATSLVMAQGTSESPGAIQQQQQQQLERQQREQRLQERPVAPEISVPQGGPAAPASTAKTIQISQILIDRSDILPQAKIDAIISPLEGQTVSLADLQQAIDAINALYAEAGQSTARAILPPQTIKDGLVRIRLVEARVGEVRVLGTEALDPAFVADRVTLEAGELLSVPALESALVRFNRLHATQLRAGVVAGSQFGTTDVEITAVEPPRTKFSVFFDNAGRDTVGETRGGLNARFANLMGRADTLQFVATRTEGSENYALSYAVPLDWHDLRLDLSASKGNITIVDGPFEPLDITGSSSDFTAGLTYPLLVSLTDMWSVYGRLSARESSSAFGGFEQEKLNLRVLTLGVSGEHQSDDSAWYVDQSIASGISALGGDQGFLYYRGSATRFDRLSERLQLLTRGGLQFSDTRFLPASELFQIGGAYTVRGFSEGLLSGRNGYFVSAELRIGRTLEEYQLADPDAPNLTGIVFIDHGGALPYRPGNLKESTHDDYLTSVGFGLLFDFSERVTGRIVIGQPLRGNPAELHDKRPRAHVSLNIALN
ncbi:ShlB/FhaC/HecB family hemolysin secretion/activation protein [Denitromonas iodatirespirans]|uniref:ShlB/FhaC/HecB family hemolysin secretion/activation protein n=1 Tax=Denitromonas iodatirespirans TaxID=2795389 RepID=A0A944DFA6_DENI1|nr:ShlB/FhaC/HecB family hemolysin secretion/activation protein [Denitromonas iodatirespirans]MBT0964026.1 ShlB/FhaC/HecB family hemolysin secretion/activation protein [Denitromonas iodatirespirans]